jgi:hypothetical protein
MIYGLGLPNSVMSKTLWKWDDILNFIGEECIVCHKKFNEEDDVVVCEVCGTPYHRECYKVSNRCINDALHETGGSFQRTNQLPENFPDVNVGSANDEYEMDEEYGNVVKDAKRMLSNIDIDPDVETRGVTNLEFYLYSKSISNTRVFHISGMKKNVKPFSILALLVPQYYLASKRMYVESLYTTLINIFLEIPFLIQSFNDSNSNQFENLVNTPVFRVFEVLFFVLFVLFRLAMSVKVLPKYFDKCIEDINNIKKHNSKKDTVKKLINTKSGINLLALLVVMVATELIQSSLYILIVLLYTRFF